MHRKQHDPRARLSSTLGDVVVSVYDHFSRTELDSVTPCSQRVAAYLFSRLGDHPQLRDKLFT